MDLAILTLYIITYMANGIRSTRSSATYLTFFLPYLGGRLVYGIYTSPLTDRDGECLFKPFLHL